ncbi:methyltransferase domain-containing protein [Protaetiibacter intestinalis]|uniref:Methyltransferase domain-containing protein n=2 Tax=Protaetiibacter intestinalis TaxID=2419774 RepID=A0A387BES1_9MICO|nr:methyltransferase domain-containing protein [Protaetiibacter intestinalis]
MDDPACDLIRLEATYRHFRLVNRLLTGWRGLWAHRIRPLAGAGRLEVLDLGSGGGDLARLLAGWARREGVRLRVTAADPDPRAYAFAARRPHPDVVLRCAGSAELVAEGARFDLVISNHVLHHLDDRSLGAFLADSAALAPRVLHDDLRRSALAAALFGVVSLPFARGSFLRDDGLLSIRRSRTPAELRAAVPEGWRVERAAPFRLLLGRGWDGGTA